MACIDCQPFVPPVPFVVETWVHRDYDETYTARVAPPHLSVTVDPFVTDVDAAWYWKTTPVADQGTYATRTYIAHNLPAGAASVILRADLYTFRASGSTLLTTPTLYAGVGGVWSESGPFADFDDIGGIVWSQVVTTADPFVDVGPFPIVVGLAFHLNQVRFVLSGGGDAPTVPTESAQWNSSIQAPGEAAGGGFKYNLEFYGASAQFSPSQGQPVNDEFVANGDGTTTTFTTVWPYIARTLRVEVDGILVAADPSDPTTGAFRISFAPADGESIIVNYQGA